MTVTRGWI